MQRGFRIEPGSAARSAEQEKKAQGPVPTFRIGSAAKSAEERAKASEEAPGEPFRSSVGVRMSVGTGQKFELGRPTGPGEALPVGPAAEAPAPAPQSAAPATAPPQPQGVARLWGKFRGLFGRKL
ncbi:MAG TPA: hypothetical protein VMH80_12140 [Bryobacteraceae bacterium]|nr:hypothetical protein [Bryobacteraceae bacterium]